MADVSSETSPFRRTSEHKPAQLGNRCCLGHILGYCPGAHAELFCSILRHAKPRQRYHLTDYLLAYLSRLSNHYLAGTVVGRASISFPLRCRIRFFPEQGFSTLTKHPSTTAFPHGDKAGKCTAGSRHRIIAWLSDYLPAGCPVYRELTIPDI